MTDLTISALSGLVVSPEDEGRFIIDEQAVVRVADIKISTAIGAFYATVDDETHPHNGKRVMIAGMCAVGLVSPDGRERYVVPRSWVVGVASGK